MCCYGYDKTRLAMCTKQTQNNFTNSMFASEHNLEGIRNYPRE